ncbi:hypothetical protein NLJ89_g9002 [Agrocybe chaxingu]|uniref:Uncharacterized protein n=1 Tax=Agrocybe chaxingu TaxID=84603 RepID=A0A9W8JU53_9AGAR|nr:hypothetical protein NLJ89_g9002 [Agrocybe chaxingu]
MSQVESEPLPHEPSCSQVLENQDILSLIFDHFLVEPLIEEPQNEDQRTKYREDKKHLLWAALVSRAFAEPALDVIWRRMESLLPLFKIFPNFDLFNDLYTFKGHVSEAAIDRFDQYARRIQILDFCEDSPRHAIASHALLYLSRIGLSSPLLPALHSISIHASNPELTNTLLFIQPTNIVNLSSLKLDASNEDSFSLFLVTLSQGAGDLQRMGLEGDIRSRIVHGLAGLSQLQYVDLEMKSGSHTEDLMEKLALIPSLTHLYVTIGEGVNVAAQSSKNVLWFPALNSLSITGDALKTSNLTARCRLPRLETLDITWTSVSQQAIRDKVLKTTVRTLTSGTSHLNTLRLSGSREMGNKTALSSSVFDLSVFSKVQEIHVVGLNPKLSDGQVQKLAESGSWSSLQILDIPDCSDSKSLTLRSLHFIARHCPNLRTLNMRVYINTENIKSLKEEMLIHPVLVHPLNTLHIGRWNDEKFVGNTFSLGVITARYLDCLFPFLEVFGRGTWDRDQDWWVGIQETLEGFREIRREIWG